MCERTSLKSIKEQLYNTAKLFWHGTMAQNAFADLCQLEGLLSDNIVIIGARLHEICIGKADFLRLVEKDGFLLHGQNLHIEQEQYYCISPDSSNHIIYGTLTVQKDTSDSIPENMDFRFSLHYHVKNSSLQLHLIHYSYLYPNELPGQNLPLPITKRTQEALLYAEKMKQLADQDRMTGLYNHVTFEQLVTRLLALQHKPSYFLLVDLDYFKTVNDSYGHQTGDNVLKHFAALLIASFPETAYIGRIGGDEFAIYIEDYAQKEITGFIIDLQKRFRQYSLDFPKAPFLGCSAGIVNSHPLYSYNDLYRYADKALYQTKRTGRGNYMWFGKNI